MVISLGNGTQRGFNSEIALTSNTSRRAVIQYVDWTYSADGDIDVVGTGAGTFELPLDVVMQGMYKTNSTVMRLQVGSARVGSTVFIVAEGTRANPLPEGGPDSSFLLATRDKGASWTFRRAFDRQKNMPVEHRKADGKSYPRR